MRVRFLKPAPDCNICRCVPSPQSIRKRYSLCLTICAESPRFAEGADAEVPRKSISNKVNPYIEICHRDSEKRFKTHRSLCTLWLIYFQYVFIIVHQKKNRPFVLYFNVCRLRRPIQPLNPAENLKAKS